MEKGWVLSSLVAFLVCVPCWRKKLLWSRVVVELFVLSCVRLLPSWPPGCSLQQTLPLFIYVQCYQL